MRLTIRLDRELLARARKHAAEAGVSLRHTVEAALRAYLGAETRPRPYRLRWRTERGRLRPGVNLDDRRRLFHIMESPKRT